MSPFDDPFASASSSTASGADMCLGLEMLRGADVRVKGEVGVRRKGEESPPKQEKGRKGKQKEEQETVEIETPTDVRVYVDERCVETVEWFEDMFCREGRQGMGVRLDAGGEEVIVFASLPPTYPDQQENLDSAASTSAAPPRPPLMLLLGRPSRSAKRKPRPDDPMPREESLFTKKLRKTASLPASAFSLSGGSSSSSSAKPPKPKRQTAKDKAIASLLGPSAAAERPKPKHASSLPPSMAFPPPPLPPPVAKSGRSLARSASSSRLFAPPPSRGASREPSLPPLSSASLSRRNSLAGHATHPSAAGGGGRSFARTTSRSSMLLDSPPSSDAEDDGRLHPLRFEWGGSRANSRAPSPALSLASTSFGFPEEDEESQDAVTELRSFSTAAPPGAAGRAGGRGGMSRSSSLPVGQFGLSSAAGGAKDERERKRRRDEREGTALPPVSRGGSVGPPGGATGDKGEVGEVETRNKNTVKKLALARLTALGMGKEHSEFKEVFQFATRGVAFAMRTTFKLAPLTASDRKHAEELLEQHLRMYLPSAFFPPASAPPTTTSFTSLLPTPTPEPDSAFSTAPAGAAVKVEPVDEDGTRDGLPSPKSLGDAIVEAVKPAEDDFEMAETQLDETQLTPGGETYEAYASDLQQHQQLPFLSSTSPSFNLLNFFFHLKMSCAVVSPMASPRLAHPSHRTSYPLASILRGASSRTPMNSPAAARSPAARAIAASVADYFSLAAGGEGATRTPVTTPAAVGGGLATAMNSPRRGLGVSAGNGLDVGALSRSLNALAGDTTPIAPSPLSFSAAGACLSAASTPAPASSLSARRRPSLRICDLPPLVMPTPTLDSLHLLTGLPQTEMARGASETSCDGSEAETVVAGGEWSPLGEGCGLGLKTSSGRRVPTPYPERCAFLEDAEVEQYL
ncbi:hypothetical protein JCM10213v2_000879 [Rhodosporidiobolus nylandii]